MFVDAHHAAEAFALGASTYGRIEGEHIVVGRRESDAVGFESHGEAVQDIRGVDAYQALAAPFEKGGLDGVRQAGNGITATIHGHTVDEQIQSFRRVVRHILDVYDFTSHIDARKTFLHKHFQLSSQISSFSNNNWGKDGEASAWGIVQHAVDHILGGVASYFLSTDGRIGMSGTSKEQSEVVVDLSRGADRRTGIARRHLLLDRNSWRQTFDIVALGLVHTSQKLACIGRKAFDITALSFGIKGVEG